jgi:hypothetical protein
MDSMRATAFFSRPFDSRIQNTVECIMALCKGIDIETVCVDSPSPSVPSTEANTLIKKSDFLIALCSRIHKIENEDAYLTSTAVREEIAAAQAMGKKVIFFFEQGVKPDGFAHNRATSHILNDASSLNCHDIEKILKGIHDTKLASIEHSDDIFHATGVRNFHIPEVYARFELKNSEKGLIWEYTIEKHIVFEDTHDLPITSAAYCGQQFNGCTRSPNYKTEFERNGKKETPSIEVLEEPGFIELKSTFDPLPKVGDTIFLREKFQSPFLGPIYSDKPMKSVNLKSKNYNGYDGVSIIHRTHSLKLDMVFPEGVGFKNITPIVATFSNTLDYIHEQEISKIQKSNWFSIDTFDGITTARLRIDRPLYQYFYGLVWNLSDFSDGRLPVAAECSEWL